MKRLWFRIFITLIINIYCSDFIHAQSIDQIFNKFIKRYHTYQNITLPYYLFLPAGYNPAEQYPLVLCLHGAGERGDNSSAVKNNSMAIVWARDSNQTKRPCFIVVPQCPINEWWSNTEMILSLNDILDSLLTEFPVDINRLYVTGLSMGGYGTWSMIIHFPDKFAAAVPMSGGGDSSKAFLIKHIPIWDFHGAKDGTVPVIYSRQMISALENAGDTVVYTNCNGSDCSGLSDSSLADKIGKGAKVLYTEYQNGGHSIWDQAYNNNFLLPWVFSQTKSLIPDNIEKESFSSFTDRPALLQNFPNPFNPSTTISFTTSSGFVSLKVYDILGREVEVLFTGYVTAGSHNVQWKAQNIPAGIYFYCLQSGSFIETKKMILLK